MSTNVSVHAEVEKLKTEIADIENRIIQVEIERENQNSLKNKWRDFHKKSLDTEDTAVLKQQIDFLEQTTGLVFSDTKTSIINENDLSVRKKVWISGQCGENMFELDMDVQQSMDCEGHIESKTQQLSKTASDKIWEDLKDTIERLVNDCNAQGFISLVQSYTRWDVPREVTFQHFMKKYPTIVTNPSESVLCLSHLKKKCAFRISWDFKVTDLYQIVPDISLKLQIPKKGTVKDSNNDMLKTLPESFNLMLEQLGIEQTFNVLITLCKG